MQPPLLAEAALAASRPERGGRGADFIREVLPALRRYYDWLDRVRDPDQDGLIAVIQADETGLDHTPKFDAYLGIKAPTLEEANLAWHRVADTYAPFERDPEKVFAADKFIVEDVMVNTIYAKNLAVLANLYRQIGDDESAKEIGRRAARTRASLYEKCWDEDAGAFFDLAGSREKKLRVHTFTSLMPLVLEETPPHMVARLVEHVKSPKEYASRYPLPTVSMAEPRFRPDWVEGILVFRGTTWMNANWYISRGLRAHGEEALARHLEDQSALLIAKSGFREHYNPLTGEGYGAHDFSWSGLVLDMMATRGRA
jgi:glycogen debranching enzyme